MFRKHFLEISTLLLFIFLVCLFGCQKETSNEHETPAYYLTLAPWHFIRYDEDDSINGTIDYTFYAMPCETGSIRFSPNDSIYYTPGSPPCNASDVAWQAPWQLNEAGTILHFSNDIYTIRILNDSILDYYYDSVYSDGVPYRLDFIYTH
jgi:hypothetical protein